jgi:hypothetical protein
VAASAARRAAEGEGRIEGSTGGAPEVAANPPLPQAGLATLVGDVRLQRTVPPVSAPVDEKIIPLTDLHRYLASKQLNRAEPDDEFMAQLIPHIFFYMSWFPTETTEQFNIAHRELAAAGTIASPDLMILELYATPKIARYLLWAKTWIGQWNTECGNRNGFRQAADMGQMEKTMAIAQMWTSRLGASHAPEQRTIRGLFHAASTIVERAGFDFRKFEGGYNAWAGIARLQFRATLGILGGVKTPEPTLDDAYFTRDAGKILAAWKDGTAPWSEKPLLPAEAARVWQFFQDAYCSKTINLEEMDLWIPLENFLKKHPHYIARYIATGAFWQSQGNRAYPPLIVVSGLLEDGVVPSAHQSAAYRMIAPLKLHGLPGPFLKIAPKDTVEKIEARLMVRYLEYAQVPRRRQWEYHSEDLGQNLLERRFKAWGAERAIAFLKTHMPAATVHKLAPSFRVLRFLLDKDRASTSQFLAELGDPTRVNKDAISNDPLLIPMFSTIGRYPFDLFNMSGEEAYKTFLSVLPSFALDNGEVGMVENFYFLHHPYRALYRLPKAIRPTGAGTTYVAIDSFHNPQEKSHPEKRGVQPLQIPQPTYDAPDRSAHGVGVTTMAVGDRIGLAPNSALVTASVVGEETGDRNVNLALSVRNALREVQRRHGRGHRNSTVVGLSLGLTVPKIYRRIVQRSPIFRELQTISNDLHRHNIPIVASSGNDGKKGHVNIIGMLPHVILAGAMDGHLTIDRTDDTASQYSTGDLNGNGAHLWAHADPALYINAKGTPIWASQGGTSAAQPHLSATILLLREVNPTLTVDEIRALLERTADGTARDAQIRSINPMKAVVEAAQMKGASYSAERAAALVDALGGK